MGFLRSYIQANNPANWGDQRRRAYQKRQWRKRVDAQMRGVKQPQTVQRTTVTVRPAVDLNDLERLSALHRSGELSDAEFAELKARLLNGSWPG